MDVARPRSSRVDYTLAAWPISWMGESLQTAGGSRTHGRMGWMRGSDDRRCIRNPEVDLEMGSSQDTADGLPASTPTTEPPAGACLPAGRSPRTGTASTPCADPKKGPGTSPSGSQRRGLDWTRVPRRTWSGQGWHSSMCTAGCNVLQTPALPAVIFSAPPVSLRSVLCVVACPSSLTPSQTQGSGRPQVV